MLIGLQHLLSNNQDYELPDYFGAFVAADLARTNAHAPSEREADCPRRVG
jgi:hypothetical protein